MARIDVTEVLLDPDFLDDTLLCERQIQTVGDDGIASNDVQQIGFGGVVTSATGQSLNRTSTGERVDSKILIVTRFKLIDGEDPDLSADVVLWNSRRYTVMNTADYSMYGRGFVQATCELIPLRG